MGTSTDAILFYGYCWDEETDRPWTIGREEEEGEKEDEDEDWMNRYARAKGRIVDDRADWSEVREFALASGCEVSTHCSRESPMPFVAVTASLVRSWRGHKNEVQSLAVDPAWDGQLAEFCKTLGIQTRGLRIAWWLVSDWS